jgi:hypothetical protein
MLEEVTAALYNLRHVQWDGKCVLFIYLFSFKILILILPRTPAPSSAAMIVPLLHLLVNPMTPSGMTCLMVLQRIFAWLGMPALSPQSKGTISEGNSLPLKRVFHLVVAKRYTPLLWILNIYQYLYNIFFHLFTK